CPRHDAALHKGVALAGQIDNITLARHRIDAKRWQVRGKAERGVECEVCLARFRRANERDILALCYQAFNQVYRIGLLAQLLNRKERLTVDPRMLLVIVPRPLDAAIPIKFIAVDKVPVRIARVAWLAIRA